MEFPLLLTSNFLNKPFKSCIHRFWISKLRLYRFWYCARGIIFSLVIEFFNNSSKESRKYCAHSKLSHKWESVSSDYSCLRTIDRSIGFIFDTRPMSFICSLGDLKENINSLPSSTSHIFHWWHRFSMPTLHSSQFDAPKWSNQFPTDWESGINEYIIFKRKTWSSGQM